MCQCETNDVSSKYSREMDAQLDLLVMFAKVQLARRVVDRIAAQDDQQLDLSCAHRFDQFAQRCELIDRFSLDGRNVFDGRSHVAELSG